MNLSLKYLISRQQIYNKTVGWYTSGVIEDEGQLIDKILN